MHRRQGFTLITRAFTLVELLVVIAIIVILAAILFPVFAKAREKARQAACLSNLKQISLGFMQYVQDYDDTYPIETRAVGSDGYGIWTFPDVNGATHAFDGPFRWPSRLQPYIKNRDIFQCPSSQPDSLPVPSNVKLGYWANGPLFSTPSLEGVPMASVTEPANVVWLYDDLGKQNTNRLVFRPAQHPNGTLLDHGSFDTLVNGNYRNGPHNDMINVLWADGHVKAIKNRYLKDVIFTKRVWP